ncbi:MAG: septum formation initiator family protein [Candidatus Cryptobacteroides sp.]
MSKFADIWNKRKDGNRRPQRSFVRWAFCLSLAMLLFLIIKKDNIFRWAQAGITIHRQEQTIEANKQSIGQMQQRLDNLNNNRDSLEKFARERFNFAEKGEDIFLINDEN